MINSFIILNVYLCFVRFDKIIQNMWQVIEVFLYFSK